ncbi:MAG: hypothetical protein ACK4VY_02775 [Brevundimonas sp.]
MMSPFNTAALTAILIAAAVMIGLVRLWLWQRSAPVAVRAPQWRLGLLAALQIGAGLLLYLVLFPPEGPPRSGVLVVATSGSPRVIAHEAGDTLVALPEVGEVDGAVRVPDLATALRRFPAVGRIRVEGGGLPPRDQAAANRPVDFVPPPIPRGLIHLALPAWAAAGAPFSVGGQVGPLPAGTIELVDPANVVVDRVRVAAGGRFVLTGQTRAAGLALFTLRLRDAAGETVEQVAVPIETRDPDRARVLVLAGAPGAEVKYLRRWAEDAGLDLDVEIDLGAGARIGDGADPLTRASLAEVDLLVVDDRRWDTLDPGARDRLAGAVDAGLGLLLRPTGALAETTRRDWATLGLPLTGGREAVPLRLDAPAANGLEREGEAPPAPPIELARRDIEHEGPDAISLLRDPGGQAFASWRSRGAGRIGVWTVTDSYTLVLTGRPDRYGDLWSAVFSALARPGQARPVKIEPFARTGARVVICQLDGAATVVGPDSVARTLQIDPAAGEGRCAAVWPDQSGWHVVRDGEDRESAFYVHPAGSGLSLKAFADREATLALAAGGGAGASRMAAPGAPGSPWPWFAALLFVLAALWWLERNRPATKDGTRPAAAADEDQA